jgi:hypothetical protein
VDVAERVQAGHAARLRFVVAASHKSGIDWTVVGVLFTAAFTGGIVVFSALAYRLGRREARARNSVLYKFPIVDIFQEWLFVKDSSRCGFQLRLFFQNTHESPIGYDVESLKLRVRDQDAWQDSLREAEETFSGIVSPTLREAFTLAPVGPFEWDEAPMHVSVEFAVKYGTVESHERTTFRWREKRQLVATLALPPAMKPAESIPFTWTGRPTTERIQRRKHWSIRRR